MRHTFYEVTCERLEAVCTILCQSKTDFRYDWMTDTVSFVLADDEALKIEHIESVGHGFKIRSSFPTDCGSVHTFYSK